MSYRCENCRSLFFKTLETRLAREGAAILYKKRCKRCKHKCLVRKVSPEGTAQAVGYEEWAVGQKVSLKESKPADRGRVFVGEYSARISHAAEETLDYLNRIETAKGLGHDASQTAG